MNSLERKSGGMKGYLNISNNQNFTPMSGQSSNMSGRSINDTSPRNILPLSGR